MKLKRTIQTVILFLLTGYFTPVNSQSRYQEALKILDSRGEVYFSFKTGSQKVLYQLDNIISIDEIKDDEIFAYANRDGFISFTGYNLDYKVLLPPGLLYDPVMKDKVDLKDNDWDFYPTYEAYVDLMYQFEEDYPELCEVFSIGETINERELIFARISDSVGVDEGEAQFMYTGTMHGDETAGYILSLRLIDYLLSNYEIDSLATRLVDNLDIWINPLANPDGTYYTGNSSVNGAIRYNANFVDLNRNYPDPEDGPNPDGNVWQPETIIFMELADSNNFVMSANFHGGVEVCNYPWDTWPQLHADDDWWQYVCHEYADTAQYYSPGGYMTDFDDGITNGYEWYSIDGGRQDYMNYFHHCREFTLELSDTKLLPDYLLPDMWDYNYRSLLNYMEQALFGINGTVTDLETGEPVSAMIFIESHDIDSSMVFSSATNGRYFRPVYEGTYDLTFSAPGYVDKTIMDVYVQNKDMVELNVELQNNETVIRDEHFAGKFVINPNPCSQQIAINYSGIKSFNCQISLNNINGKRILTRDFNFNSGQDVLTLPVSSLSNGVYIVNIRSDDFNLVTKLVKRKD